MTVRIDPLNMLHVVAAVLVVALVGCAQESNKQIDAAATTGSAASKPATSQDSVVGPPAAPLSEGAGRWLTVPDQWRFPKAPRIEAAGSWEERLARLPTSQQTYLRELNDRYLGVLAFDSPEEQQRLIKQGFPMPEEWLAAQRLLDSELETLAETGNLKAQMFQVDRVGQQVGGVLDARGGLDATLPEHQEMLRRMAAAKVMNDGMLRSTKSPFAAYQYGQARYAMTIGRPPEYLALGLLLAGDLGDQRAYQFQQQFSKTHPGLDGNFLLQFYSSARRRIDR